MDRRAFLGVIAGGLLAAPLAAEAEQAGKTPLIGFLRSGSPPDPFVEAFRQGLRELGYVEGQNIRIEYRWAEGRDERLPELVADLVRLRVDVIVASGQGPALIAKQATSSIPIVMPVTSDPVSAGLVSSLARPGGNVTGLANSSEDLPGKWLQLLKEALPMVSRVAVLWEPTSPLAQVKRAEAGARSLGLRLRVLTVGRPDDFGTAFAKARKTHVEALRPRRSLRGREAETTSEA